MQDVGVASRLCAPPMLAAAGWRTSVPATQRLHELLGWGWPEAGECGRALTHRLGQRRLTQQSSSNLARLAPVRQQPGWPQVRSNLQPSAAKAPLGSVAPLASVPQSPRKNADRLQLCDQKCAQTRRGRCWSCLRLVCKILLPTPGASSAA